ncbi:MAG: Uma2 family endonuclease [Acidobacteriota bacterium]|nr:Uma2 family endonuclease [Acidobacteriota bacterium]
MSAVLERTIVEKMTADEFESSPFVETHELIRGELYSIMPAGALHGLITNRISRFLANFVDEHSLGEIFAAETGFKLKNHSTVGADVAFVGRENLARFGVPDSFFPTAPDLAVEVISPSNTSEEISTKVEDYLSSGSRLVWIVYPKRKVVVVYRANNTVSFLHEPEEIDGEDVIPNFRLPLDKVFGGMPQTEE